MNYVIEPLGPQHDRGAFCCGNEVIDKFFVERGLADHNRRKVRIRIARAESSDVLGFYSLVASTLAPKRILGVVKFGPRPIPAIYLAMIGVCEAIQGLQLGKALMLDAFEQAISVADRVGAYCLWLQAVDERTVAFYEKLGFERVEPGGLEMYIPIDTIVDALSG